MSVRRPAPLVAQHEALTVGALAERMPGSMRLSQVLAAGAKHLAKHKTADTEAKKRKVPGLDVGFRTSITRPVIAAYVNMLTLRVQEFLAAEEMGQISIGALQTLSQQIHSLVARIVQKANSVDDMEVLRRMGAYFVLNWLYQHGTPQQSANAQLVLSEDLHGEDDDGFDNILGTPNPNGGDFNPLGLAQGVNVLGLADGPALALAPPTRGGVILNGPGPSDFEDARKAEERQNVEDRREAKRLRRQQDIRDKKISKELEKQVEKKQDADGLQDGEVVKGMTAKEAARNKAEERAEAQGDNLGGGVGDSGDYDDTRDATDDEEDDFEGNPQGQQVDKNAPQKRGK